MANSSQLLADELKKLGISFSKYCKQAVFDCILKLPFLELKQFLMLALYLKKPTNQDNEFYEFKVPYELLELYDTTFKKINVKAVVNYGSKKVVFGHSDFLANEPEINTVVTEISKPLFFKTLFLILGSINSPSSANYHLEFKFKNTDSCFFVQKTLLKYNLDARISKRLDHLLLYIKSFDQIVDFLNHSELNKIAERYTNCKIDREVATALQRRVNCETANIKKTSEVAAKQIKQINFIFENLETELDPELERVMKLRLKHPYSSLSELQLIYISTFKKQINRAHLSNKFIKVKNLYDRLKRR